MDETKTSTTTSSSVKDTSGAKDVLTSIKSYAVPACIMLILAIIIMGSFAYLHGEKQDKIAHGYYDIYQILQENPESTPEEQQKSLAEAADKFAELPISIDVRLHEAYISYDQKDWEKAASIFSTICSQENDSNVKYLACLAEADCHLAKGDIKTAKEMFDAVEGNSPWKDIAQYKSSLCSLSLGKGEEAEKLLQEIQVSSRNDSLKKISQSLLAKLAIIPIENFSKIEEVEDKNEEPETSDVPVKEKETDFQEEESTD